MNSLGAKASSSRLPEAKPCSQLRLLSQGTQCDEGQAW